MYDPIAAITASSLVAGAELGTMIEAAPENPSPAGGVFIDFDIRRDLGRAGTRTLDRAAALAMHAVGSLPGFTAESPEPDPFMGLVMASTMGSIQSTMDFTRDSFTGTKPYHVDPARFPNTVMNFAAGQCAIRYGIQGPNATVTTGHVGSLSALAYASRLLRGGHAKRMVVAASEELSEARAVLESAVGTPAEELGEGSAAVLLELLGANPASVGELLRLDSAFAIDDDQVEAALSTLLKGVLNCSDGSPRVKVFAPLNATPGSVEMRALETCVDPGELAGTHVVDTRVRTGDLGSVSGLVQLQAALAALRESGATDERDCALVTSLDREGAVHVVLARLGSTGKGQGR
jgi:3-oxoacyl-[acyl-carrier-protein] synthase II